MLAALADAVVPDPVRWHPVAGFGHAATALERVLWRDSRLAGTAHSAAAVLPLIALGALLPRRSAVVAVAGWGVLGGASLRREAADIECVLVAGDLAGARARLPRLCGREPSGLGETDLARAVVESVAENTCDAVVAPLLWGAVAGVPGLLGYRAINTLDAMVGHRSPRYARFGWSAARLDDAANWLPARLTALLAVAAAGASAPRAARPAYRVWRRDGARHPSPNAGQAEAAFAGVLDVRLGGPLAYEGWVEQRPVLHASGRPVQVVDIARAVRLSRQVSAGALLFAVAAAALRR